MCERLRPFSAAGAEGSENVPVVRLDVAGVVAASWRRVEREEVSANPHGDLEAAGGGAGQQITQALLPYESVG